MTFESYPRLPDDFVNKCLEELEDLARVHAIDKANLRALEKKEKVIVARLIREAMDRGVRATAAKDLVYEDHDYRAWLDQMKTAVAAEVNSDEDLERAKLRFEAWRTVSANFRRA